MRLPHKVSFALRSLTNFSDLGAAAGLLANRATSIGFADRLGLLLRTYRTTLNVDCAHTEAEIIAAISALLSAPSTRKGCFVEAGCFKGGSTAKFSLAAKLAKRRLFVFDSFEGLPDNDEEHGRTIYGETPGFQKGRYRGALDEVKDNVGRFGAIEQCEFIKGWFDNTMPGFREPIVVAYIDVDLVSSTKTCVKYLFPLIQPGGVLISQDGHLPLIIELLDDDSFWTKEIGCAKPEMLGLGKQKLVTIIKA